MENHDILSPALQKYYSALKSLSDFGFGDSFFDDVSSLDTFFSEFRNITFVIQKGLKTEKNKKTYEDLRDTLLSGDTLKWFVETRNKTTKQKPFSLKKELIVDLYLPQGITRLTHKNLTVDFDDTFDKALESIKSIFINKLGLVEIFFSVKIRFIENDSEVDFYPKIKNGLIQMNKFTNKIKGNFPCNCDKCDALSRLIENIFRQVLGKEIAFVRDYAYELNKELIVGDRVEMYFGNENSNHMSISDIRIPLKQFFSLGEEEVPDEEINIFDAFIKFSIIHTICFQQQEHSIMPVFMIVFADKTCKLMPFITSTKSTFYRKIVEIVEYTNFDDVVAVFYCGEYYTYSDSPEAIVEILQKPYSERREMANNEILSFTMLLKGCGEWSILLDENRIDDMEYVTTTIRNFERISKDEQPALDWLSPIKEKMNLYKNK